MNTESPNLARWNLVIADQTDRAVRMYLAGIGAKKGDLSRFVEEAVRRHLAHLASELPGFHGVASALEQVVLDSTGKASAFRNQDRVRMRELKKPAAVKKPR